MADKIPKTFTESGCISLRAYITPDERKRMKNVLRKRGYTLTWFVGNAIKKALRELESEDESHSDTSPIRG